MPFGTIVSIVICTLTTVPFLLLNTAYIVEGVVTERDRRPVLDEEIMIQSV